MYIAVQPPARNERDDMSLGSKPNRVTHRVDASLSNRSITTLVALGMTGNGWSPLFVASWSGHAAVVAELLAHSADPAAATAQDHLEVPAGSTALSVAQLKGHSEVAALLLRA